MPPSTRPMATRPGTAGRGPVKPRARSERTRFRIASSHPVSNLLDLIGPDRAVRRRRLSRIRHRMMDDLLNGIIQFRSQHHDVVRADDYRRRSVGIQPGRPSHSRCRSRRAHLRGQHYDVDLLRGRHSPNWRTIRLIDFEFPHGSIDHVKQEVNRYTINVARFTFDGNTLRPSSANPPRRNNLDATFIVDPPSQS